jgi:molybdopterin synthase sulfur carrier subunit
VIRVVYLGKLADIAGRPESQFGSSNGELDWPDLVEVLRNHVNPEISEAVEDSRTRVAVNGELLADKTYLVAKHGDEIALLPPVSGG